MENIIQGATLGAYKTVGIALGTSKKPNNQGKYSNYIVLSLKNKKSLLSNTRRVVLFDEDLPGVYEGLKMYATSSATDPTSFMVDMVKLKSDPTALSNFGELLEFPGGMVVPYQLSKGWCYQNDVNGNITKDASGQPIKRNQINVFVQVDMIKPDDKGNPQTIYVDGFGLNEQGARYESRFYRTAVEVQANNDDSAIVPELVITQQPVQPGIQGTQSPAGAGVRPY